MSDIAFIPQVTRYHYHHHQRHVGEYIMVFTSVSLYERLLDANRLDDRLH